MPDQVIIQTDYIDLGEAATLNMWAGYMECIAIGALVARLILFLTFFRSFNNIVETINRSSEQLFLSFAFVFLVISGFTLIAMNYWGASVMDFSDFI